MFFGSVQSQATFLHVMSTNKSIIFETLPDGAADEYYETAEALKDLDRQYRHFTSTVWKVSKQLSGAVTRYQRRNDRTNGV